MDGRAPGPLATRRRPAAPLAECFVQGFRRPSRFSLLLVRWRFLPTASASVWLTRAPRGRLRVRDQQIEKVEATGIVVSVGADDDGDADAGLGFISKDHLGDRGALDVGDAVDAVVLDVNDDGVCEMSLKSDLVDAGRSGFGAAKRRDKKKQKKKRKSKDDGLVDAREAEATVQLVKPGYLVVSLAAEAGSEAPAGVFHVPMCWHNTSCLGDRPERRYQIGDVVTVHPAPGRAASGGCGWQIATLAAERPGDRSPAKRSRTEVGPGGGAHGALRAVVVEEIKPHCLIVAIRGASDDPTREIRYGSIHITDTADPPYDLERDANPMRSRFKVGQVIEDRAVAVAGPRAGHHRWVQRGLRFGKPVSFHIA